MAPVASTLRHLAILGGSPAFPHVSPVPLISPRGYRPKGDFSAVDAILANEASDESKIRASKQRFVSKVVPGVENASVGYRIPLQRRIGDFLAIDNADTSVICVTSGTNALRAVLKGVRAINGSNNRNDVIVPQLTVGATIEAVIDEGFKPVFVDVHPHTWLLSPEATEKCISENTAAIVTVDWLGTQCDLGPFRKLANKYDIKLISDSAQSFGASKGRPPSVGLADATIYSLGYPKVFTGAGSGGVIVCPREFATILEGHPTGILRHETLPEINAFMCLRALDLLPEALKARAAVGEMYRHRLADIPGIVFQEIPDGMGTNHYQISFLVQAQDFGLDAKDLCKALKAENIHCSADRMPCIGLKEKFLQSGVIGGDVKNSRLLAASSATLPISNDISLGTVGVICSLVRIIYEKAADVLKAKQGFGPTHASHYRASENVIDIESKFRSHFVIPISGETSVHSRVFVPRAYLMQHQISVDEFLHHFMSRQKWNFGDPVIGELVVNAVVGKSVILGPKFKEIGNAVALDESGSSANVTLVIDADGKVTVRKSATGYGIDGNGAPWLRRQSIFLGASYAVKKTEMFVEPLEVINSESQVTLVLPYIASHTFGELIFANVGAKPAVAAIVDLLARMANSVWTEGQEPAHPQFIKQAHFNRMRRRVNIARESDDLLDTILKQRTVMLNGRRLEGFDAVLERLEAHPELAKIQPTILSEIHGDLNIHNILGQLDPKEDEPVKLIDPRGVPLLDDSDGKVFERGDYVYDVSKLLFSLTGFSEIRKKLYDFSVDGDLYELKIKQHPGSETMNGAARILLPALVANEVVGRWIDKVEPRGAQSFVLRARLCEAAHFVADCACALGRDTSWEVVPLFLMGLEKLNDILDLLDGIGHLFINDPKPFPDSGAMPESANFGVLTIQSTIFGLHTSKASLPYDVLEVSVKSESAALAQGLFRELVGTYLPKGMGVYLSTDPVRSIQHSPCVIIHPSNGVKGETHMLAAATRRTSAFFRDNGVPQNIIDEMKIVHISSTGSSSRSQFTAMCNDKLLAPGSFGISPLKLAVLQANQLTFPKGGRWVLANDSIFLLSRPLKFDGDGLCILAVERPTTGACNEEMEIINNRIFAKGFKNIIPHEKDEKPPRWVATGIFVPHHLAEDLSSREDDYASRWSPLLVDVVLPHFEERDEWISICHKQGYGVNSHIAWKNAQDFMAVSPSVNLADGGDKMVFYYYGSDTEYDRLLSDAPRNAFLNSLAYVAAAAEWRCHRVDPRLW